MTIDSGGSYLREPAVSERALQRKLEVLADTIPLNDRAFIERSIAFDETTMHDIDFRRSKKELEASLDHKVDNGLTVKLRYSPALNEFIARELIFPLPGTIALKAHLELTPDETSYDSFLRDSSTDLEIGRQPVQPSTANTILAKTGIRPSLTGADQNLAASVFATAQPGETLHIEQSRVISEQEMPGDISGTCSVIREQSYSDDDIVDVIKFVEEVHVGDTSHARIISSVNSQNGATISAEQITVNHSTDEQRRQVLSLDYETLEKLIANVQTAIELVD